MSLSHIDVAVVVVVVAFTSFLPNLCRRQNTNAPVCPEPGLTPSIFVRKIF